MMKLLKSIFKLILLVFVFGAATAGLDYFRMINGFTPIFNISKYDEKTMIQSYRGLFYQASRKVKISTSESLTDSSDIEFIVLSQKLDVPKQFNDSEFVFTLKTKAKENCSDSSVLYYADKDIKVYTYCLESIDVLENNKSKPLLNYLKKDNSIIENIDYNMAFTGINGDKSTLMFKDTRNFSDNGLTMYRCNKTNINDVYFAPSGVSMQNDFCTYKDDDFKFIFEIEEAEDTSGIPDSEQEKEVVYEDENYRYEFDKPTIDRITITTPEVRGKAATSTPLRTILENGTLTIDELIEKGLKVNKIDKAQETAQQEQQEQQEQQQDTGQQ